MTLINVKPNELLATKVQDYIPSTYHGYYSQIGSRRPLFTQWIIREMLLDPRVKYGLGLIKGPLIQNAKIQVESNNEVIKSFVETMFNNFWSNGAEQALKAIEWGFSGSEVLYKRDEETGQIMYKGLKDFDSANVRVVTKNGKRTGLLIDNFRTSRLTQGKAIYLGGPKCLHHIHERDQHPFYGRSRLQGAHIPWNEIWSEGGFRDIRRLWFYKNAFESGVMYHPQGSAKMPNGEIINYQDYAQDLIEKKRTGATLTLPSTLDAKGNPTWRYEPPKGNTIPAGLFDYEASLRVEILEALCIPPEVIESSGNEGFGSSSGREIPQIAFYSTLQIMFNWLVHDFKEQVIEPIAKINAAMGLLPRGTFEVNTFPLEPKPDEVEFDGKEQQNSNSSGGEDDNGAQPKSEEPNEQNGRSLQVAG